MTADQAPTHTLPNSTSAQSRGAQADHKHKHADVGRRSSSGSGAADDTVSGQHGGFPADPGPFCVTSGAKGDCPSLSSGVCGMDCCGTFTFKLEE